MSESKSWNSIKFTPNKEDIKIITYTMSKYNLKKTEAIRRLIHNQEANNYYIEKLNSKKEFDVKHYLDMKNAMNYLRQTGNVKLMEEVMEEFRCRTL